jgi:tellurite resistance protein TehA-like permease
MAPYQLILVIKLFSIASVMNQPRKSYTKTQTIIELVVFCILIFLSIIVSFCVIIIHVNRPRLIQIPL